MATDRLDRFVAEAGSQEIRRALAGRHPTVSPNGALYRLWRSPHMSSRTRILRSVLEDPGQPPMVRQTAALYLGKIDRPSALSALEEGLGIRDPIVRGGVLRALGRIGDREALGRIRRRQRGLTGWVAREAQFAVTLLAYRHGLEGHEVRLPRDRFLDPDRRRFRELEIRKARRDEQEALARSLVVEPLGIPVAMDHAYRMVCGPRNMLIVLNGDLVRGSDLHERLSAPTLAAQILHWHHHDEAYAPIFYLLSHPARQRGGGVRIAVLNSGGRLCCTGSATVGQSLASFVVRAVDIPGNTPAHVEGTFEGGAVDLTKARVGLAVRRSRRVASAPTGGRARIGVGRGRT